MSDKMPYVAIDKVEVKLTMKVKTSIAVDKVAKKSGLSRASVICGYVEDGLDKAKITLDSNDLKLADEIILQNLKKREAQKVKKGIK